MPEIPRLPHSRKHDRGREHSPPIYWTERLFSFQFTPICIVFPSNTTFFLRHTQGALLRAPGMYEMVYLNASLCSQFSSPLEKQKKVTRLWYTFTSLVPFWIILFYYSGQSTLAGHGSSSPCLSLRATRILQDLPSSWTGRRNSDTLLHLFGLARLRHLIRELVSSGFKERGMMDLPEDFWGCKLC